ncbi:hypothetical protein ACIQVO_09170 [Streptomyces sp. NPDC101062]|uniref:hypothetical protein n=1 Tax=unclassified Streptomyces TaxID=2593676 RepID=UPI00382F54CC
MSDTSSSGGTAGTRTVDHGGEMGHGLSAPVRVLARRSVVQLVLVDEGGPGTATPYGR